MPNFSPTGFSIKSSSIATAPAHQNVATYFWNPTLNGYSGDMLVPYLIGQDTPGSTEPSEQGITSAGYVYPCPVTQAQPTGLPAPTGVVPASPFPIYVPTLGVAMQFRYTILDDNGKAKEVISLNYNKATLSALYPGTQVQVDVYEDPFAIYDAQLFYPNGVDMPVGTAIDNGYSLGRMAFCAATIVGLEYEQFDTWISNEGNPEAYTFWFVKGSLADPYSSGSRQGLAINQSPVTVSSGGSLPGGYNVSQFIMKGVDTSIAGNSYNTPTTSIGPGTTCPNPTMITQQLNNYLTQSMYIYSQVGNAL